MALEGSVKYTFANQGAGKGGNPMKDRLATSVVTEYEMAVVAPRDSQNGMATGKRNWQAIRYRQPCDAAVIQYQQALVTNEVLTTVMFNFFRPESNQLMTGNATAGKVGGEKKPFYTVELTNAQVQSVRFNQLDTRSEHPDIRNREIFAEILLTFMKITQTWCDGGVTMTDDWNTAI